MKSFDKFLKDLISKSTLKTSFNICGKKKTIKAMIHLTTINFLNDEGDYIKIYFKEDGYLLIIPKTKEVYYSDTLLGKIPGITSKMIGKKKVITYKGKKYYLENKDDYQFVLRLYLGNPLDIEGECEFSDYYPKDGSSDFLSLGWLSYNGKRADLHPKLIGLSDIKIVKW